MIALIGSGPVRTGLDRAQVLDAAVALVDEAGLSSLTMRRLGRELGVEAMALYRYVPSREDLLNGVVERVIDELYADPEVHLLPEQSWQEYLIRLANGVRRIALTHPQVFPLVATRPPAAPWMQPPLRSLRWVESLLTGLLSQGFSKQDAVYAYRAFSSFLLGHLLLEVGALGVDTSVVDEPVAGPIDPYQPDIDTAPLNDYPLLVELAPQLADYHFAEEFADSLHNLLDRLGPGAAGEQHDASTTTAANVWRM